MRPSEHVLDMFAVPGDLEPLPGGRGHSVRAGDLVLSPGRDEPTQARLNPHLARLAADLDTRPGRDRRDLRIAMPVPARDGNWVVEGWGATRFEPGTRRLTDLAAVRATGAVLHAELASAVRSWAPAAQPPTGRWAVAERIAFGELDLPEGRAPRVRDLAERLAAARSDTPLGPAQLVHGDLAGNVLLDPDGAPVVIDVAPYWRPALWADATCVLDGVADLDADPAVMTDWTKGAARQAMLRAGLFRLLSDRPARPAILESALAPVLESPLRVRPAPARGGLSACGRSAG